MSPVHHPRTSSPRLRYLPALDGLRGLAVLAVLGYHAELSFLPGGFLGVELFFVVSGFLITSLLLVERRSNGSIDLRRFWVRRARRLLPALALVLAAVSVVVRVFLPEDIPQTRGNLLAAAGYVTNWELIWSGQSYFEATGRPPLLQHLWSLAVEEQYYLLWPVIVAGLLALVGRRGLALACALGAVASTALMWVIVDPAAPSRVYYGTDTRAGGLLLGGLLALTAIGVRPPTPARSARWLLDVVGAVALGGILTLFVVTSEFDTALYRGGFLRFSAITVVVLFVASVPGSLLARSLALTPLVWVGLRSYGLYLWHWPVFQLTRPHLDVALDGYSLLALRLVITFVVAEASLRLVERPLRDGALGRLWDSQRQRRSEGLGTALSVRLGATGAVLAVAGVVAAYSMTPLQASDDVLAAEMGIVRAVPVTSPSPPPKPTAVSVPSTTTTTLPSPTTTSTMPVEAPVAAEPGTDTTIAPVASVASVPPVDTSLQPAPTTAVPAPPAAPPPPPNDAVTPAQLAPVPARPVHAVGDSVLLAAGQALEAAFAGNITIDGMVGRQAVDGVALIEAWAPAHPGEDLVVVLGSNGILRPEEIDRIMAAAGPDRRVVLLTVAVPRRWEAPNNDVLRQAAAAHPNAVLVDWHALVAQDRALVGEDGVHPRNHGDDVFAAWVRAALP